MPAGGLDGHESDEKLHRDLTLLKPRAYQLEMLEESLRQNVIVAVRPRKLGVFEKSSLLIFGACRWKLAVGRHRCVWFFIL